MHFAPPSEKGEEMNHSNSFKFLAAAVLSLGLFSQTASAQVYGDIRPYPGNGGGYNDYRPPGHHYGEINRQDARRITRLLYQAILFRNGETSGVQGHAAHIEAYGVDGLLTVAYNMAESAEFHRNIMPRYTPRQIVQNIYRVVFNRQADPSGLQHWSNLIRRGQSGEALRGIVGSDEFLNRHVYGPYGY